MRIVVTGGAGFIGLHVVTRLTGAGHTVVVVDSLRPDVHRDGGAAARARLAELGVDLVVGDVRDADALGPVLTGVDAVVHLAAKVGLGVDLSDMTDYVSSNVVGTAAVLQAAAAAGVRRVVQASSMVVYGEGRYDCPDHGRVRPAPRRRADLDAGRFDPRCPRCGGSLVPGLVSEGAPTDPLNAYAASKVAQEHLIGVWSRETAGTAVSLRLHNVYGPGMPRDTPYAGVAAIFSSQLDRGERPRVFEDGRQRRDFVHVTDVARAFESALGAAPGSAAAFNVGSGRVGTVGDLARALSVARDGLAPVVTGQFRMGDVRHITASSALIRRELGWQALVTLADGVRDLTFAPAHPRQPGGASLRAGTA